MEPVRLDKERLEIAGHEEQELINLLFILFKTAQYVDANNSGYLTQSAKYYVAYRRMADRQGKISVKVIDGRIFVCEKLVRFDSDGMVRAKSITDQWHQLGIGGIVFDDSLDNRQIDKFVHLLATLKLNESNREQVAGRLADLGIEGITLLAVEDKSHKPILTEERRVLLRRTARANFFRAISVVEDVMVRATQDKEIDMGKARRVVHSLIDQLTEDETSLIELTSIRDFDEYTYAHSTNVCVYALTIGVRLGLDKNRLSQLGFAALFHDIGKVKLPGDLIRKPDAYDENDWLQMQQHPILGAKTIFRNMRHDNHTARAAVAAFEHHINEDLTGYPVLRKKEATNLFSKIIAVADTFDALSSGRVYMKKAIPPDEVLRKMMYQMTVKFDAYILKLFVNIIGIYPAGTLLLLSTDELAIVAANNAGDLSRPQVRIIGNRSGAYSQFIDINLSLSENDNRKIVRIIDPAQYNIDIKKIILTDN